MGIIGSKGMKRFGTSLVGVKKLVSNIEYPVRVPAISFQVLNFFKFEIRISLPQSDFFTLSSAVTGWSLAENPAAIWAGDRPQLLAYPMPKILTDTPHCLFSVSWFRPMGTV
jgi:hypothetical protein